MADVTIDPENSNPKELYGQGVRAFILQDYDTAIKAFSRASEILSQDHGSETHDSLGDVYLYYGKSLLELSRRESDPLGEGVLKNVEEESEEEIEGEDEDKTESNETPEKSGDIPEESGDIPEEKSEETANGSTTEEPNNDDELTDLQVAWEVLELAKKIFTARGSEGKKNLAETLIILGEISLESGNFSSAIEDISEGLKIQKTIYGNDSRTIAETYYKLGGAFSTNGQISEAIESFTSSLDYLKNKIQSLEKEEKDTNTEEIEELKNLIPEIEEKIADMKNLKTEVVNQVTASVEEQPKSNGNSEASSSSKQVNDISHLVKRKRRSGDTQEETPAKKPSP